MPGTEFRGPVLLTGAGREGQVGESVARALAERGATLLLVDRNPDQARDRASALTSAGFKAFSFACDLADQAAIGELAVRVRREHGDKLGALVHVAGGFAVSGGVADSDFDVWNRMMSINVTTAFLVTRAFLPSVRAARGAIVYFASEAALPGAKVANVGAYAAAKSGVVTLMRAVAQEERDSGVRANALAPTSIRTAANVKDMGSNVRYVERDHRTADRTVVRLACDCLARRLPSDHFHSYEPRRAATRHGARRSARSVAGAASALPTQRLRG